MPESKSGALTAWLRPKSLGNPRPIALPTAIAGTIPRAVPGVAPRCSLLTDQTQDEKAVNFEARDSTTNWAMVHATAVGPRGAGGLSIHLSVRRAPALAPPYPACGAPCPERGEAESSTRAARHARTKTHPTENRGSLDRCTAGPPGVDRSCAEPQTRPSGRLVLRRSLIHLATARRLCPTS